jgi:hypothetical protein
VTSTDTGSRIVDICVESMKDVRLRWAVGCITACSPRIQFDLKTSTC